MADYADRVYLLSGKNSKKEHKEILNQMNKVRSEESMILVAAGKLIGEAGMEAWIFLKKRMQKII